MSLSKRTRFEIFKRDEFTCQYCGNTPPNVVLEVDHVIPKSKDGSDEIDNLITSCFDCNRGKSNISITKIQKRNIVSENTAKLKEQEEQLREYYKIVKIKEKRINRHISEICNCWLKTNDYTFKLNETGRGSIRKFLEFFTEEKIKEAIFLSQHIVDVENRFKYFCGILHNWKREMSGDFSKKYYNELKLYWKNQPKGAGYLSYTDVKRWLEKYEYEEIKEAMDKAGGYWNNLKDLLN